MELIFENIRQYFDFCQERHAIYLRRQAGDPWPWTDDTILQTYKMCNVYRELDTGTIWLREHIREPYADHQELFFNIAAYRRYNYWPTAELIGWVDDYPKQQEHIVELLRNRKELGGHIFTGAHMLNCQPGVDKITHVFETVLPELWKDRKRIVEPVYNTLESVYQNLLMVNGFGPFLSYEVVSDLRHTRYLRDAPDIMTWANPGPGAQRGLLRLAGIPIHNPLPIRLPKHNWKYPNDFINGMRALLELSKYFLPDWMPVWEMRTCEHALCEYDKYERVRLGEGRPRSKFIPPHLRKSQ